MSSEFELFNKMNDIRHIKVSPHHPDSTALAERAVQTVKSGISKMEGRSLQSKVTRLLSRYRITPQTITGISSSQLDFVKSYPMQKSVGCTKQTKDA